jgi:surface carbohydrate biosynthesis protein
MGKILYLPIETIVRELDARILLAHRALNRGYSVIIGHKHNVLKAAGILKNGIYFNKAHGRENFPKDKNSLKFVSLDEEGLVFADENEYLKRSKPDELEHLDIILTWGSYQRDLLIKANPKLKIKTIPVGNPRFDILRPEFRSLYESASKRICKKWGKYVLINTNFVPGNFSRLYGISFLESETHRIIRFTGREPTDDEKDIILDKVKYYEKLFKQYVKMIQTLSLEFPGLNFILRPHPSEDILNWRKALEDMDNIHVVFEDVAINWIFGSLAVIHTGCTTGIEAWALGKNVIAYNPDMENKIESPLPNKFGLKITDIENLCEVINNIINGESSQLDKDIYEGQLKLASIFIKSITGDYSVSRFLDVLDDKFDINSVKYGFIGGDDYIKLRNMENIKQILKLKILKILSKYQSFIEKNIGKKFTQYIYSFFDRYPGLMMEFKKFPELKLKEVRDKLTYYDHILYNGSRYKYLIRKIATDTYLINKDLN